MPSDISTWDVNGNGKLSHRQLAEMLKQLAPDNWDDASLVLLLQSLPDPVPIQELFEGTSLLPVVDTVPRPASRLRTSKILREVHKYSYTAGVNADSVTSIAYALSALGYPLDPDNVFYESDTNVADVTDEGLTLGQAYSAALRLTSIVKPSKGLPLKVEMQTFTDVGPSLERFRMAVSNCILHGAALLVQYDVSLAHFEPGVTSVTEEKDEDSFALIADYDENADEAIIVDPAPHRWMKMWRCPLSRLIKAMRAIDPENGIERGALCISHCHSPGWGLDPITSVGRFPPSFAQLSTWRGRHDCEDSLFTVIPSILDKHITLNGGIEALALALNAQGYTDKVTYDGIFHVAELPIAECQCSFDLNKTHAAAVTFITRKELPLKVESFSAQSFSEQAFYDFCCESTSRKDFWKYDSAVFCFDRGVLDSDCESGKGCIEYAMLVDESNGILMLACTVPKLRGRFFSCSVSSMYKSLSNAQAGVIRICSTAKSSCTLLRKPCYSMDSVIVKPYYGLRPIKGDTCKRKVCDCCWVLPEEIGSDWRSQANALKEGSFDSKVWPDCSKIQPFGVEPLEALSMALGSLGFPFTADAICSSCRVPIGDMLAIRMTLASLFDNSRAFLRRAGVPFRAEVVHFDDGTVDVASFRTFLESASRPPFQDALVFAFNVNMAYGDAPAEFLKLSNGHFALFVSFDSDSGLVTLADSRPSTFGTTRKIEFSKLFNAMCDKEGGHKSLTKAGRRRGVLRIAMHASKLFPDMPNAPSIKLGRQETPPWDMTFWEIADFDHISLVQFQQPLNCCNNTALAYATTALGFPITVDDIFEIVKPSIRSVTSIGLTLAETYEAAAEFYAKTGLPLRAEVVHFDKGKVSEALFREELIRANDEKGDIHIVNFKVNIAHGAQNIGGGHYALVGAYLEETDELIMADVNPMKYLRYWKTSLGAMYRAMCDPDSDSKRARGFLRVALQSSPAMKIQSTSHIYAEMYQCMAFADIASALRVSRQA